MDWVKLTPEIVDGAEADLSLGLKFDFNPQQKSLMENETLSLNYTLRGEWASDKDINTEPIEAKMDLSFDRLTYLTERNSYYYGYVEAGYESDDRLEEQEMDGGITLAASYKTSATFKLDLLGHYRWVYCVESEQRNQLGGSDTDVFRRLELEALAVLRLRRLIDTPIIRGFKLSGNYRYFYQHGLDRVVDASGEDDFDYIKGDLAYEWWPSGVFGLVQEIFISYSYGHLPTQWEDQSVWTVGILFYGAE